MGALATITLTEASIYMRTILFLSLSTALVFGTGCGDDGGDTDTSTGDTGTSDTSTGDTGTGDTGTADGGDTGTADGGGASAEAITFCESYSGTCGFDADADDRFDDSATCTGYFDGADADCTTCLDTHLGLAGDDADTHCPHATGAGPCNGDCP